MTSSQGHTPKFRRQVAGLALLLSAVACVSTLLTSCTHTSTANLAPGNPDAMPIATLRAPSATPTRPFTATPEPTLTPSPAIEHTVIILHTNDVCGQMDPCG